LALAALDFSIIGELDEPRGWTWKEFRALPSEEITRDIHCVTKWSKLDTVWEGVSVDTLLDGIETSAEYVTQQETDLASRQRRHDFRPAEPRRVHRQRRRSGRKRLTRKVAGALTWQRVQ
jgi:DMSO/TMAO reductase YedYZ molybdopterin-dependent catalytic subunit